MLRIEAAFAASCAVVLALCLGLVSPARGDRSVTTVDPYIPLQELNFRLKPLTADKLLLEADAWMALLTAKVEEVSAAEVAVFRKNQAIEKAEMAQHRVEEASEQLEDANQALKKLDETGSAAAAEQAREAVAESERELHETAEAVDQVAEVSLQVAESEAVQQSLEGAASAQDEAAQMRAAVGEAEEAAALAATETSETSADTMSQEKLEAAAAAAEDVVQEQTADKSSILETLNRLRTERTELIDRLNVVLDELNTKLGTPANAVDHERVRPYRLYGDAVSGIVVDVTDSHAAWSTVRGWLVSPEGGIRWLENIGLFLFSVTSFWLLGQLLGRAVRKGLKALSRNTAVLLQEFIVNSLQRLMLLAGILLGLAALEINMGPLLAMIGAAGFVIAFALQSTLSNFASGLMIMFYRPFDIGDVVDVAGVTGVVKSMNLVSTTITTFDNKIMVVPNNSIWGNIITNITGSEQRRVDFVFGIGYGDNVEQAKALLREVVEAHPAVLKQPEALIKVNELADSSVNLICRPWARTVDYWTVYWDVMEAVKKRFDAAGITIPYPQQSVHIENAAKVG